MEQLLTQFITPVVGLWAVHNVILASAEFVNKMRETVISGMRDNNKITPDHRRAILIDWSLSMIAVIGVCIIFSGILIVGGVTMKIEPF
jgi:hypothetical protein